MDIYWNVYEFIYSHKWWRTPLTSALEAEAGGSLSSRPAWSIELVPGQPGLHRETLAQGGWWGAHAFNPSTWEAEAGRYLSSRPA